MHRHNPWLNYTLALHRCREFGYHHRIFDLIDERPLTKEEVQEFCILLFGKDEFESVPDVTLDWKGFYEAISELVRKEIKQWDSIYKRPRKLIHLRALRRAYGSIPCFIL